MSNLNKVMLMGRLTRDPELRYTPQGIPVSDIGLAINRESGSGAERKKETTFVDVTLWRRQAEVVCEYMKKGSPIFVEGRLSLDSWEGQDGQKRSRLRVVADQFQFIGGREGGGGGGGGDGGYERSNFQGGDRSYDSSQQRAPSSGGGSSASAPPEGAEIDDSEIPF